MENRSTRLRRRLTPNEPQRSKLANLLLYISCSIFLFVATRHIFPEYFLAVSSASRRPHCAGIPAEKFIWFAPHSGFSNQLSEFKNGVLMAAILNRTLIVPPILDHHAVVLGSCPKFRVLDPNELRFAVWNHSLELLRNRRYVSMTDVIDLSSVLSDATVRMIDFRVFVSKWCNLDMEAVCYGGENSSLEQKYAEELRKCGRLLSGYDGSVDRCVYAVHDDCRTTVWTYQKDSEDGILDSFQPNDQLKRKNHISFVRRRRDVVKALGPGSDADSAAIVSFGSLFTALYKGSDSYIDIHECAKDRRVQSLIEKIEFLPFVPEILNAGKEFSLREIKSPFLCAQLRLLDGQFKNHWKSTFLALKEKLESLKLNEPLPIHVFVMTDLPMSNWTGTYLGDLARSSDNIKLFSLREDDDLITATTEKLTSSARKFDIHCDPQSFTDILLYVEQTVCSCATLGFVGTAGSTIAETVELMRRHKAHVQAEVNLLDSHMNLVESPIY